jgi:hypothetical protein
MIAVIDTNVLVRFVIADDPVQEEKANQIFSTPPCPSSTFSDPNAPRSTSSPGRPNSDPRGACVDARARLALESAVTWLCDNAPSLRALRPLS